MLSPLQKFGKILNNYIDSILGFIILIAFLLRVIPLFFPLPPIVSDAHEYYLLAQNLLEGNGFSLSGNPTAYRMPGYPFLLAGIMALSHSPIAIYIFQALCETLTCVFLFFIGKNVFSKKIGLVASAFWATFPVSIFQTHFLLTESCYTTLLTGSMAILFSSHRLKPFPLILLGTLCGYASLIKPHTIGLIVVIFIYIIKKEKEYKTIMLQCGVIMIVTLSILSPWIIRNWIVFEKIMLTTNGGVNFWIGNNPQATGSYYEENSLEKYSTELEKNKKGYQLGWEFINSQSPKHILELTIKKCAYLFSSESPLAIQRHHVPPKKRYAAVYAHTPLFELIGINIHYVSFMLMGTAGIIILVHNKTNFSFFLSLFIGFWIIVHLIYFGASRFHYPILPFFILTSSYFLLSKEKLIQIKQKLFFGLCVIFLVGIWMIEILTVICFSS